jgi:hypothetical protein
VQYPNGSLWVSVRRETGTVTAYDKKGTITRRFVPGVAGGDASDIKLELDAHLSFTYEIAAKRPTLTVAIAGVRQSFIPGEMLSAKLKREGANTAPAPGTPSEYVVPPRGGGKKGGKSPGGALSPREAAAPPVEEAEGGGCGLGC